MNCKILDLACHAQSALWRAWDGLGLFWQAIIVLCLLAVILGSLQGFLTLLRRIGGWPAVAGFVGLVLAGIVALLPKRPKPVSDDEIWQPESTERRFRVPPRRSSGPVKRRRWFDDITTP